MADIVLIDEGERAHAALAGSSCAFGVFDGVHRGHRSLLDAAVADARARSGRAVALTFDIDPDELFHPDRLRKLMSNEARLAVLAETGVDHIVVLRFTREFGAHGPEAFLDETFGPSVPATLHVGCDFRFGARAAGTLVDLAVWGERTGMGVVGHELKTADGDPITATRIRLLLAACRLDEARELLGRPYRLVGTVRPGRGEGRDMGFRTANLIVAPALQVLGEGVYAAWAEVDGARYKAAVSVGVSPMFADRTEAFCEVHLLDFEGDLYGRQIAIDFEELLRPMMAFDSVEELIATVTADIERVRTDL